MSIETDLPQKAVVWEFTGNYDGNGNPTVSTTPIEVCARWERTKSQQDGPDGQPISIVAIVDVDRYVAPNSRIRQGCLANLPTPLDNLREVVSVDEVPDIKAIETQYSLNVRVWNSN